MTTPLRKSYAVLAALNLWQQSATAISQEAGPGTHLVEEQPRAVPEGCSQRTLHVRKSKASLHVVVAAAASDRSLYQATFRRAPGLHASYIGKAARSAYVIVSRTSAALAACSADASCCANCCHSRRSAAGTGAAAALASFFARFAGRSPCAAAAAGALPGVAASAAPALASFRARFAGRSKGAAGSADSDMRPWAASAAAPVCAST